MGFLDAGDPTVYQLVQTYRDLSQLRSFPMRRYSHRARHSIDQCETALPMLVALRLVPARLLYSQEVLIYRPSSLG